MSDNFINVRDLVSRILQFKKDNPLKKVAFCFSGGGARGAWFGGVIEAIQQEVNRQQPAVPKEDRWKPDMICGSSAGGLAGFAYWLDCAFPSNPAPYACRQSKIWSD
jgi:predicted acylesterase/phospholipase RssA